MESCSHAHAGQQHMVQGQYWVKRELKISQLPHPYLSKSRPKTHDMALSFPPQISISLIFNYRGILCKFSCC